MGLDMYLSGKQYIHDWAHHHEDQVIPETTKAQQVAKIMGITLPVSYVEYHIGDWRKANQIHRWFVNHVQDGVDNCESYYVSPDALRELRAKAQEVLDSPSSARDILPTESGFFFGSTEFDEWYFEDLHLTIEIIDRALSVEGLEYYYRSSW